MTNLNLLTLDLITKEKQLELLKLHKSVLINYLNTITQLNIKSKAKILAYYDKQINRENIEEHYNLHIGEFLNNLLT